MWRMSWKMGELTVVVMVENSGGDGGDSGGDSGSDGGDSGGEGGEVPRGEPSKKKTRQERKIWNWAKGDLDPKEMPTNNIR